MQEFVGGLEVSCEGWFDGNDFYCLNGTLEEKKFMNDGIGPNTGCAGNLVFLISRDSRLYRDGLRKVKDYLQTMNFRGPLDLNAIVTDSDLYGLEWTPRFGYDALHTFSCMYNGGLGNLFHACATGVPPDQSYASEFGACVRLSIPPYPSDIKMKKEDGIPIKGLDLDDKEQVLSTFMYDVTLDKGQLESAGVNGFLLAPCATASYIPEAFEKLKDSVKKLQIPDVQYRTDIQKKTSQRYYQLLEHNWI